MNVQHHACNPKLIGRLLRRELCGEEQATLESHLEVCSTCREMLDAMTADVSWWRETRDFLLGSDSAEQEPHDGHDLNSYLAPTDDPRMLGRVGPYEIAGGIGSGGMGVVLKGFDGALNRYVALKLLA